MPRKQTPHTKLVAAAEREARRKKVAANLLAGLTFREMAEALGCSVGTVHNDVRLLMTRWHTEQVSSVRELKLLETRRLDRALNAIWGRVQAGDLGTIDRLVKLIQERARLFGLYAPQKVAPTNPAGDGPAEVTVHHEDDYPAEFIAEVCAILGAAGALDPGAAAGARPEPAP
jgi:AcrR family transcriptional regulator